LPDTLGYLPKLESLNLSHNYLRFLPAELDQLQTLTALSLVSNHLLSLPCSIYKLNNLASFSLDWMKYTPFNRASLDEDGFTEFWP
jgi:leucine-rich repeat protein SHOC2